MFLGVSFGMSVIENEGLCVYVDTHTHTQMVELISFGENRC